MDILSFVVSFVSILGMILVATAVVVGDHSKSKIFFAVTIYSLGAWLLLQNIVQALSLNGESGLRFVQFISAIPFVAAAFFYMFICSYTNKRISSREYVGLLALSIVELALNMSGLMIQKAWGEPTGIIVGQSTVLYQIYVAISGVLIVAGVYRLVKVTKDTKIKKERARNRLLIIGFFQSVAVIAISNIFFRESSEIQMFTPVSLLIMAIIVGYAIVKYQFFDIKSAVLRAFAYALSLFTLSAIYYSLAYLLSISFFRDNVSSSFSVSPVNVALALVLAFVFQPIKKFFDKYTNKFFYKEHYKSDDFFARLNKTLAYTTELRDLLERAANEIGHTLKGEQAFFFIYTDSGHYVSAGTDKHKQLPVSDALQLRLANNNNTDVVVASLLPEKSSKRRLMISHKIELILPLIKHNKCIGFLCLGEHLNSGYTNRDVKVLNTISNELVIAIQNALAVQEIREFNETLKQQIANATKELRTKNIILQQLDKAKDEFVGMASHQLRTPLTSIKGYISMVLEGDAGKISGPQAQLLNEAFTSSERMVRLINDFLNVSRLQTGKFMIDKHPVDLSKVVEQEIDSLQSNAVVHGMKFVYDLPKDFPMIDIDEGKMRQVIMNFADNAIYYSHDGSTIIINLSVDNDNVIFTVQDTGIGVPADEQPKLFSKFYRATNARKQRPDGTGVGLYLAKKIIMAHDGKIIFNSTEAKGSTFGFSLPLKQN